MNYSLDYMSYDSNEFKSSIFDTFDELACFILADTQVEVEVIYMIYVDVLMEREVFVTDSLSAAINFISMIESWSSETFGINVDDVMVTLKEFNSYEVAYEQAALLKQEEEDMID